MIGNTHRREIFCFILIGSLATGVDFGLYWWWQHHLLYSLAKASSFISGSVVAYLLNKFITFQKTAHSTKEMIRFTVLYSSTMFINVAINSGSIQLFKNEFPTHLQNVLIFSFLIATAISTILNFIGQKFWVFRKS